MSGGRKIGRRALFLPPAPGGLAALAVLFAVLGSGIGSPNSPGTVLPISLAVQPWVVSESPTCAAINSNTSLESSYAGLYYSLANNSPNWGVGPNMTTPVNQSGYRNVTAGGQMVVDAWISICDSSQYTLLYTQWGRNSTSGGGELDGANGHYLFFYGFAYQLACPNLANSSAAPCSFETSWSVDLVTGAVVGPTTTNHGNLHSHPLPYSPPGGTNSSSILSLSPDQLYAVLGVTAAAVALLGVFVMRRARGRNRPPPKSD